MSYEAANFQIMIIKSYYVKQTFEIAWNKAILDNSEKGDEAKSSNESRAKELK